MYTKEEILKAMADMDEFRDWSSYPIPAEIDHMILALLRDVKDPKSYEPVLGGLRTAEIYGGLLGFGWRACSWAVQETRCSTVEHLLLRPQLPRAAPGPSLEGVG